MTTQELTEHVLALPVDERIRLAEVLLESLDGGCHTDDPDEDEIIAEALRRADELDSGAVKGRTHEEVMRTVRRATGLHD